MSHTYVTLEVSAPAYDEIAAKLKAAAYGHAFSEDGTIDMHGLALTKEPAPPKEVAVSAIGKRCYPGILHAQDTEGNCLICKR